MENSRASLQILGEWIYFSYRAIISGGLGDTQWTILDLAAQYADKRRHAAFSCENGTIHLKGIKI